MATSAEHTTLSTALLTAAARHANRDAIVLTAERLSYGELVERATLVARSLLASGVDRGDRVGILMANCIQYVELLFGTSLIGAVPVLYNARFKAREIAHVTADAGVKLVVTNDIVEQHTDYVELLCRALPGLGAGTEAATPGLPTAVFLGAGSRAGFVDAETFERSSDTVEPDAVAARQRATTADDVAAMFYTSGTTAMPKGCPLTHTVLQHAGTVGGARMGLVDGDALWTPLPMFHTGFTQPLAGVLSVGGTLLSMTHFEPGSALQMIRRERPTVMFPAFPTITTQLLNHPDYDEAALESVRTIVNVGPPDVLRAMQQQMPTTVQISVFGMTETGGSVAMASAADPVELRLATSGRALPDIELRIVDPETGTAAAPDARGEIVVRGVGVFSGYHNDPAKTAEAIDDDGWFHTGDLGSIDAEGYLTFQGRLKDMLKVGGENVAAIEVEGFLATHPAVNMAQVVGVPDDKYGEVPVAFIELLPGQSADESELIAYCRGEIASFKVPRHVRFVTEWPMGATKILKYLLRDQICAELGLGTTTQ